MGKPIGEMYVVEWSEPQGCFHIEPVSEMLDTNRSMFNRQFCNGYVPLAIFETHKQASEWCLFAQEIRDQGGKLEVRNGR